MSKNHHKCYNFYAQCTTHHRPSEDLKSRGSDPNINPSVLVYQHDDIMVNFTTVKRFLNDKSAYFAAMPCRHHISSHLNLCRPNTEVEREAYVSSARYRPDTASYRPYYANLLRVYNVKGLSWSLAHAKQLLFSCLCFQVNVYSRSIL